VRHRFVSVLSAAAVALVVWGVLHTVLPAAGVSVPGISPGHGDYRDPAILAKAVKDKEHSFSASCSKLPGGKYFCAYAYTGGTSGSEQVTVSADGKSWAAR